VKGQPARAGDQSTDILTNTALRNSGTGYCEVLTTTYDCMYDQFIYVTRSSKLKLPALASGKNGGCVKLKYNKKLNAASLNIAGIPVRLSRVIDACDDKTFSLYLSRSY